MSTFYHAICFFQNNVGNFYVTVCRFIKSGSDHLGTLRVQHGRRDEEHAECHEDGRDHPQPDIEGVPLPGRGLAAMIAGEGIGIALNADLPSAMLIPPEAVDWLAQTLADGPAEIDGRPHSFHAPMRLPDTLMAALESSLANASGLAAAAWLAGVTYEDRTTGHLIGFVGAAQGTEAALAAMVREALVFSGLAEGWLDVAFLAGDDPALNLLAGVGRALSIPAPQLQTPQRTAPGGDPNRPPRLR